MSEFNHSVLAEMQERMHENMRRDWFRLGAKFALDDNLPDATADERDAALAKLLADFDRRAVDIKARDGR